MTAILDGTADWPRTVCAINDARWMEARHAQTQSRNKEPRTTTPHSVHGRQLQYQQQCIISIALGIDPVAWHPAQGRFASNVHLKSIIRRRPPVSDGIMGALWKAHRLEAGQERGVDLLRDGDDVLDLILGLRGAGDKAAHSPVDGSELWGQVAQVPRVLEDVGDADAVAWVGDEHAADQVHAGGAHVHVKLQRRVVMQCEW